MRLADVSLFHFEPLGLGAAYRERRELSPHVAKVLACARIANFLSTLEFAMHTRWRSIGVMLAIVGGVTTVPAAMAIARTMRAPGRNRTRSVVDRDDRLIGTTRYPRKGDDDVL
jgi:hypothetical protein